jgi:hypothetical protein
VVFFKQDFAQIIFAGIAGSIGGIAVSVIVGDCFFATAAAASSAAAAPATTTPTRSAVIRSFGLSLFTRGCGRLCGDFEFFFILGSWFGAGIVPHPAVDFVPVGFVVAGT